MIKKMTMSEKGKRKRIKIKIKRMNFGKEDKK